MPFLLLPLSTCNRGRRWLSNGKSAKVKLHGQLGTFTWNDDSITRILNRISLLLKGKCECVWLRVAWGGGSAANAFSSCTRNQPQSFGKKAEPVQLMMPVHMGEGLHETRQQNCLGFWTGSFIFWRVMRVVLPVALQIKPHYYFSSVELCFFSLSISGLLRLGLFI